MGLGSAGTTVAAVSVTDLKAHLRVSSTAEDAYIRALGTATRRLYETKTNRILNHLFRDQYQSGTAQ